MESEVFFKYTSLKSAIKIIESNRLQFSRPNSFNDPFDSKLSYVDEETRDEVVQSIKDIPIGNEIPIAEPQKLMSRLNEAITTLKFMNDNENNRKQIRFFQDMQRQLKKREILTTKKAIKWYRKRILKNLGELFDKEQNDTLKIYEENQKKSQEKIDKHFIFCGSKKHDNILMWSHYAEGHTGVVLKFRTQSEDSIFKEMRKIEYTKKRQVSDGVKLFLRKSKDWEYEQEVRVIIDNDRVKKICQDSGQNYTKATHTTAPYNRKDLVAVYFGARSKTPDTKNAFLNLLEVLNKKYGNDIEYYWMRCSKFKFKLEAERYRIDQNSIIQLALEKT